MSSKKNGLFPAHRVCKRTLPLEHNPLAFELSTCGNKTHFEGSRFHFEIRKSSDDSDFCSNLLFD